MARYAYTNAARLEAVEHVRPQRVEEPQRSFEVVKGAGLDARVREGVQSSFISKIKIALIVAAAFVALGTARIAIYAQTVTALESSYTLRNEIRSAESLGDELRVECSILCSSGRIERIATENYGMVPAQDTASIRLTEEESSADAASETDAASADDAGADAQAR